LNRLSSVTARTLAVFVACGLYLFLSGLSGLAQQAPAPGAGATPGQGQGRGAGGQGRGRGQQQGCAPTNGRGGQLGDGPWEYGNGPNRYRVSVVTKALDHPWGIAFVPGGDMLVTGRSGKMYVLRTGASAPTELSGLPQILCETPGALGGLLDVSLHPKFAENRLVYFVYSKPGARPFEDPSTTAVARGRWDGGSALTDVKDIFVADAWAGGPPDPKLDCGRGGGGDDNDRIAKGCAVGPTSGSYGARLAWDKDGLLYVSLGDRNTPIKSQDPGSDIGKILRIRDDGSVPKDNPFVGKPGWKPEIYSYGHRNPLGLWYRESSGELWSSEEGPQGGDEVNLIKAGKNYGWPIAGLGRNYDGSIIGKGFSGPDIEDPVVFWVPAIAISGLSIYDGDKFPAWKGQIFVGAMRNGTGQFVARVTLNAKGQATGRDHSMLADLRQRIREVKPGPDGFIYVLTDEGPGCGGATAPVPGGSCGAVLRIEPAAPAAGAPPAGAPPAAR
jgi:aldose sugar dehydrogenase